jgi:enediyne biosynthesis protein E4
LTECGIACGVAVDDQGIPNGSMGIDVCDYNQDGRLDLWVANYEHESFALYRNQGANHFLHVSRSLGITDLGGLFVGFGTACEDFDADGDQDFVVANGHVIKYPVAAPRRQLPLLMEYDGHRFRRLRFSRGCYFEEPREGRGLATADYDADGDVDVAISHLNEPLALLENKFRDQNRWLTVELIGTRSNRDAVGARVELQVGKKRLVRQVTGGGSYLSHNSRAVYFALPSASEPRTLAVHWPSGQAQSVDAGSLVGHVVLIEPMHSDESAARLFPRNVPR